MPGAEMGAHVQSHDWGGEDRRNPQTPRHGDTFAVVRLAAGFGFERHAADRTMPGPVLADFRMHRAGVDRVS